MTIKIAKIIKEKVAIKKDFSCRIFGRLLVKEANGRRKSQDVSNPEPDIFKRLVNRVNVEEYIIIPYFSKITHFDNVKPSAVFSARREMSCLKI